MKWVFNELIIDLDLLDLLDLLKQISSMITIKLDRYGF